MELNRLFDLVGDIREKATAGAVFGPPTQVDEKTLIPIGRVVYGFGLGFGRGPAVAQPSAEVPESTETEDDVASGSGGGGLSVQPLAVLEVTPEATTLTPIAEEGKIARMGIFAGAWSVFWLAWALVKIFGKE